MGAPNTHAPLLHGAPTNPIITDYVCTIKCTNKINQTPTPKSSRSFILYCIDYESQNNSLFPEFHHSQLNY